MVTMNGQSSNNDSSQEEQDDDNVKEQEIFAMNDRTKNLPSLTKQRLLKNLIVLSISFMVLFTAFQSLQNLQSSLNKEDGLGTVSLSVIYACSMVSSLLVPPLLIHHIGCKWTLTACTVCYIVYMAANFHAVWGTLIPASVIIGLGSSPLWVAQGTYLTRMGLVYAKLTSSSKDGTISIFFGVFYMFSQTCQVWGNLISSLLFKQTEGNTTSPDIIHRCGASYCPSEYINNTNLDRPDMQKIYTLCGIYLACACFAMLMFALFLDNLNLERSSKGSTRMLVTAIVNHFYNSRYQKLLIPLSVYSGVEKAYVYGDFTRSFVSCTVGVWSVGFVMIAYGITNASVSLVIGRLVKHTSFFPWFILGFLVHGSSLVTMLVWQPTADAVYVFYILAALWGIGTCVMQALMNAYYGYLFSEELESAFASFRICQSAGFILAFGYSSFVCTDVKIWVCLVLLTVGMSLYGVLEVLHRRAKKATSSEENE